MSRARSGMLNAGLHLGGQFALAKRFKISLSTTTHGTLMTTLAAIQKQIAELEKKAEAIRRTEVAAAVAQIRALVERYGLTAADVGLDGKVVKSAKSRAKAVAGKAAGVPKYQDPKTGKTWTGVGKPPAWIAGKKNRDAFLINRSESAPPASAESSTKRPAAKASGVKPAVKGQKAAKSAKTAGKGQDASPGNAARKPKAARAASNAVTAVTDGASAPEPTAAG